MLQTPSRFKEKGIRFVFATSADREELWEFIETHLLPEEPCIRSLDVHERTFWDRWHLGNMHNNAVIKTTEAETSVIAKDKEGKIIGKEKQGIGFGR